MKSPMIVLENNNAKIANLLMKNHELFDKRTFCVVRTQIEAELLMSSLSGSVILIIDYELDPGCGDGLKFLKFCIQRFNSLIEKIYITTFSKYARTEMINCCEIYNIKYEIMCP